ncbi:MAG: molybdate ABC transporter substrate-binding protein, partial [Caldimonas sp.]
DAALMPDKVRVAFAVPSDPPVLYPVAPLVSSPNPPAARQFVAYLVSPPAQAVLARHGFGRP